MMRRACPTKSALTPPRPILFELFTTGGDAIAVVRLQGGVVEVNGADIGGYAEGERHGIFITMNPANRVNDNFTFTMTSETEEVTVTDFRDPDIFRRPSCSCGSTFPARMRLRAM